MKPLKTDISDQNFSNYLKNKREAKGITQEELAEQLSSQSSLLAGIDSVTISRWERGRINPSIRRQVEIMVYFGDSPYNLVKTQGFDFTNIKTIKQLSSLIDKEMSYDHFMGAHPYLDKRTDYFDKICQNPKTSKHWSTLIKNYQVNLLGESNDWNIERIHELQQHPTTVTVYYVVEGILGGHLVQCKIKPEYFDDFITGDIRPSQLDKSMLTDYGETGNYALFSSYAGSKDIFLDLLSHISMVLTRDDNYELIAIRPKSDFDRELLNFFDKKKLSCEQQDNKTVPSTTETIYIISKSAFLSSSLYLSRLDTMDNC